MCVCVSDAKCHVRIPKMETQIPIFIVHDGKESFTQLIGTEMEIKKKFKSRLTSEKKKTKWWSILSRALAWIQLNTNIYIDCTTFGFLVEQLNQEKFVYEDEI